MRIEPETLSPGRRYFLMTSCILPRPIAWVGTVNADGGYNLAPFSYFNGLASTPPVVGIGFGPHADKAEKDTVANLRRTGELTISIPDLALVEQVEASGQDLPYGQSEFAAAGLTAVVGETVQAPYVGEAKVSFECRVLQLIPLGDQGSELLLAEITLFHILDTLLDDYGCVDQRKFQALARMGAGRYAGVGEVFKAGA
ncbi:flavin reductase family protein [bacterium]|nr:flavin reductase family protein [bacterium]